MSYLGEEATWRENTCYTCCRTVRYGSVCSRCDLGEEPIKPEPTDEEIKWAREEAERSARFKENIRKIHAQYEATREEHLRTYHLRQRAGKKSVWRAE